MASDTRGPELIGLVGNLEGLRVRLDQPVVVVGRDPTCDIVLEHALVSRRHAQLEVDAYGRLTLRDLSSTQGTYINGVRIDTGCLVDGDTLGFGRAGVLAFRVDLGRSSSPNTPSTLTVDEIRARLRSSGESTVSRRPQAEPGDGARPTPQVTTTTVKIGRAPDNDLVLESPAVSRYHAQIDYSTGEPVISDVGSSNGIFLNGELVREAHRVGPVDLVFLGGFLLRVNGRNIATHDLSSSRLIASGISKRFGDRTVLQPVSFAILPREFVGLMGPSGCGKSTLMDALNGLRPATTGHVFINDLDLYRNFDAVRRSIGYVPQRDVLHDILTVERTLIYAAKLRLPDRTTDEEANQIIAEVIGLVGLEDQRQTTFHQLSGGQQKRLSLAIELLTRPSFLFLDEPTSPLDPESSENLMLLFRRLSDEGRIVVMVTHKFEKFEQMHHIALLTKAGHLAYFGPPSGALKYFGCREPGEIYRQLGTRDPGEVGRAFEASEEYENYVAARLAESKAAADAAQSFGGLTTETMAGTGRRAGIRQWRILTRRYLEIKLKDRRNTALLVLQAPLIALLLAVIAAGTVNDAKTLFIASIVAVWFGANNAIREIVAEQPVYVRERLVNLGIPSYLLSKLTVLSGVALVQAVLLLVTLVALGRLQATDLPELTVTIFLTTCGGISLGLLCSALVNSTEKAMSVLPLLLIPQLLLSGFMKPLDDYYVNASGQAVSRAEYEADQVRVAQSPSSPAGSPSSRELVRRIEGLGAAKVASSLMLARWSVDALVHVVSRADPEARRDLATQFYVSAYSHVLDGAPDTEIDRAFQRWVQLNWVVLGGTAAVYLLFAALALRRKDSL